MDKRPFCVIPIDTFPGQTANLRTSGVRIFSSGPSPARCYMNIVAESRKYDRYVMLGKIKSLGSVEKPGVVRF